MPVQNPRRRYMNLPAITIPVEIPFEVPLLMHPIVVHFAIAIPIIVLILELFNLYFKRRALNVITVSFLLLTIVIYAGLFITGKTDGGDAYDLLSAAGQSELKEHKLLGIYLVYASVVPIIFKTISMLLKNKWAKIIYLVILLTFIGVTLKQGKDGGELVYEHGANVEAVTDVKDEMADLQDEFDEQSEKLESVEEELQQLKDAASSAASAVEPAAASVTEAVETQTPALIEEVAVPEASEVVHEVEKVADSVTETASDEAAAVVEEHAPAVQ